MSFKKVVLDIETTNLMAPLLNYTTMPFRLKPEAKLWCVVLRCADTNEIKVFIDKDYINYVAPTTIKYYSYQPKVEKVVEVDEEKIEEPKLDENNVPLSITPLQAKLQLLEIELLDEVEELVKQDRRVEIYWTNAQKFNKDDEHTSKFESERKDS